MHIILDVYNGTSLGLILFAKTEKLVEEYFRSVKNIDKELRYWISGPFLGGKAQYIRVLQSLTYDCQL